jgi:hypothetical protein
VPAACTPSVGSDGGRLAAAFDDQTTRFSDDAIGEQLAELHGQERHVHAVAFAPDGPRLLDSRDALPCLNLRGSSSSHLIG